MKLEMKVMLNLKRYFLVLPIVELLSRSSNLMRCLQEGSIITLGKHFEVRVKDAPVGSICGGGRYDDLTGIFLGGKE